MVGACTGNQLSCDVPIDAAKTVGAVFGPAPQPVSWTNAVGVSVSGNSLTKTAATGWGTGGATSTQQLASGDGFVEITASETHTSRMFGLGNGNTDASYTDIDFALFLVNGGQLWIYEGGTYRGSFGTYVPGDKLRVGVEGGAVKYRKNGALLYSSLVAPTYPLLVDTALSTLNATITSAVVSNWPAALSISDASLLEGNSGPTPMTFTVSLSAASAGTVTVNWATSNGTAVAGEDYAADSGTLTFNPGQTSQPISVTVNGDTTYEPDETFTVTLSSPNGATIADGEGTGTITNDDALPGVVWTSLVGVNAVGNSLTKTAGTAWGNAGAISAQQLASGDGYRRDHRLRDLYLQDVRARQRQHRCELRGHRLRSLPGERRTTLDLRGRDIPGVLRYVRPGRQAPGRRRRRSRQVPQERGPSLLQPRRPHLPPPRRHGALHPERHHHVGRPLELARTLSISDASLLEGNSGTTPMTFTVSLSAASAGTVTVNWATSNGTAVAGEDYAADSGTLTFNPGQTSQPISVTVNGDTTYEPDETFTVTLSSPNGATIADGEGTGTITNDDALPGVVWTSLVGVDAAGNSLTKTAGTAWGNAGAISAQQLASGDGYVEITASETHTSRMFGLGNGNTDASYPDIDFALFLVNGGQLWIYEGGTYRGPSVRSSRETSSGSASKAEPSSTARTGPFSTPASSPPPTRFSSTRLSSTRTPPSRRPSSRTGPQLCRSPTRASWKATAGRHP